MKVYGIIDKTDAGGSLSSPHPAEIVGSDIDYTKTNEVQPLASVSQAIFLKASFGAFTTDSSAQQIAEDRAAVAFQTGDHLDHTVMFQAPPPEQPGLGPSATYEFERERDALAAANAQRDEAPL